MQAAAYIASQRNPKTNLHRPRQPLQRRAQRRPFSVRVVSGLHALRVLHAREPQRRQRHQRLEHLRAASIANSLIAGNPHAVAHELASVSHRPSDAVHPALADGDLRQLLAFGQATQRLSGTAAQERKHAQTNERAQSQSAKDNQEKERGRGDGSS